MRNSDHPNAFSGQLSRASFTEVQGMGMPAPGSANLLIQGDNLPVLQNLAETMAGSMQCVYIDPPYNTGNAFAHYRDALSSTSWLAMMRPRLEAMRELMAETGVFFCSIGDSEMAYLKVLCDEVFGRENYLGSLIWEKKKKPSFLSHMGTLTEFILVYARNKSQAPPLTYGTTTANKRYPLNNAGNGLKTLLFPAGAMEFGLPDQVVPPQDMSAGRIVTELLDEVHIVNGRNAAPFRLRGEWRYSQRKLDEIIAQGEKLQISRLPFRPNHIRVGGAPKKMKNLLSSAHYGLPTYEDATMESRALFGDDCSFDYPKPEGLLQALIGACTQPGDWVLDAFLGSGTTAAVAHKMGRQWIGIEAGEHCDTHCVDRMQRVVRGEEPGGISQAVSWKGGGGFRFYRLREGHGTALAEAAGL